MNYNKKAARTSINDPGYEKLDDDSHILDDLMEIEPPTED
jgi:hypothetical protein